MLEREWGALSTEDWGKRTLPGTVNKLYINKPGGLERLWWERGWGACPATRNREACESGRGRKTPQESGVHFPHEL
jgi:hypothetical protein